MVHVSTMSVAAAGIYTEVATSAVSALMDNSATGDMSVY